MNSQTKTCQNCQKEFIIESEDFEFYEKIKVPSPTFCPECRLIRRMMFRNERSLYKRKCDAPNHNEEIISIYSPDKSLSVYDDKFYRSDKWDPMNYGQDYDFSKPFFEQFSNLFRSIPKINLFNNPQDINSSYCNHCSELKDCYLCFGAFVSEKILYGNQIIKSKESVDIFDVDDSELIYESVSCVKSYKLLFSAYCDECRDSYFLFNCKNCSNCFGCVNFRNKSYCIFNNPYSPDVYKKKIKEFNFGSYQGLLSIKNLFYEFIKKFPRSYAFLSKVNNAIGDNISNSENVYYCFNGRDINNAKHCLLSGSGLEDSYDLSFGGLESKYVYESVSVGSANNLRFNILSFHNIDIDHSISCRFSSHLFGCVAINHKQHCILNKQYTKEEYEKLIPKIIEQMNEKPFIDKKGKVYRYGEFFPSELSPFCYNETIAQEYFPLTKEQAIEKGYQWKEPKQRNIIPDIKTEDIPDHIKDAPDSIVGKVIECAHKGKCNEQCTEAFKIIEPELEFYRKMNLPLPRLCPNCRHYQRIKQRNSLKLWHRKCQCAGTHSENGIYANTAEHFHGKNHCPNEFETTYSPDRPEIVYCEKCYLREVV